MHFNLDHAIALTRFAAAALDVKAETPRTIAAFAAGGHTGKQFADRRKQTGVRGRVGTRRAANRRLIDIDDFVEQIQAVDFLERRRFGRSAIQITRRDGVQRVVDQRGFARARYAGNAHQQTRWQRQINVF